MRLLLSILVLAVCGGCYREKRELKVPRENAELINTIKATGIQPGPLTDRTSTGLTTTNSAETNELRSKVLSTNAATFNRYEENAWAMAEGKRLYIWFNCNGCHAHGGGGMGPPLMDDKWIYGYYPEQVVASIAQGRPNGMPAFQDRIPEHQLWQIAAYVRSISGLVPKDAAPARSDHLKSKPPENTIDPAKPRIQP